MKTIPEASWLKDSAFNLLVDYFASVPYRPYGTGATYENVVPFLKELQPGYVCVYAKGCPGYTTYPSSLKTQHLMLGRDMPKAFREYTRAANTKLVFYYSGLIDGIAGERHPDWRQWTIDGKPVGPSPNVSKCIVTYSMCPLSPYWEKWVSIQLREIIENYDPDGFWVDAEWVGPCYCPRCQARFRADTGWTEPWADVITRPDFKAEYAISWNRITHGWRTRFRNFVKSLKPDCVYSAGNVSPRREFAGIFDWRSGDFFSPHLFDLHDIARVMRWYGTMPAPYDAYICDTSFPQHRADLRGRSKTLDRMLQESAVVAANGGAVGYWTWPLGNGAWVPSRMRKAITVRKFIQAREDLFLHSTSAARTAILVSDPSTPSIGGPSIDGAHKVMASLHRSPDIIDESGVTDAVPYDLLVLPEQAVLDSRTAARIEKFIRAGGLLLSAGASLRSPELQKMLGVKNVRFGDLADGHVLPKTSDEPTGVDSLWDRVELEADAEELYPLYLSWDQFNPEVLRNLNNNYPLHGQIDEEHPEPAGCPAAIARTLGKGRIVHLCTDIFTRYGFFRDPQMLRWLREVIDILQPRPRCRTDAPSWVDLSLRRAADGRLLAHFVNQNSGRDVAKLHYGDNMWVDEIPEVGGFVLELQLARKPKAITWEPGHRKLPFAYADGILRVKTPRFKIHGCVAVVEK